MISSLGARTSLAVGAFLLTSLTNVTAPLFAVIGIYATAGLFTRTQIVREKPSPVFGAVVLLALVIGGLVVGYQQIPFGDPLAFTLWSSCTAAALVVPTWSGRTGHSRSLLVLLGALLVCSSIVGARLILSAPQEVAASDVFAFHEAATQTLKEGSNPYEAARVVNTDPNVAPGTISTGYPYPPITMAPVVASSALFGDSRWILLVTWVGVIAILGTRAIAAGGALLQPVLLLALFPAFRITLFVGWTELLLLGIASFLVLGNTGPGPGVWRTVVLGVLASSKQYMAFLAPLILVVRSLRIPVALSTIGLSAATLLPYFLANPRSAYHALYENLAAIGDRPDSFSISGMLQSLGLAAVALPRLLWVAITLIFGYVIARRIRDVNDFILGAVLVLGFGFLTGVAFVNYWLLCAGLVVVGTVMKIGQTAG